MLLIEIFDKKELHLFEADFQCFRNLKNDLNVIKEKNIPILIEAKLLILIYRKHYLLFFGYY